MLPEVPVSDTQLRCLLCDLILADDSVRDQPTETCRQCGRKIVAGQTQGEAAAGELQSLLPPKAPAAGEVELLPVASEPPPAGEDNIPTARVVSKEPPVETEVPTVQPRVRTTTAPADVPYAARRTPAATGPGGKPGPKFPPSKPPKVTIPDPTRVTDARPRPELGKALAVLGCMTLLAVVAITIIVAMIVIGLRQASKMNGRVTPPPSACSHA